MIRINLALKKQSVAGGASKSSSSGMSDLSKVVTRLDLQSARENPLFKLVLNLCVAGAAFWLLESYKDDELGKVDEKIAKIQVQSGEILKERGKFAGFSKDYDSIESERASFQAKLNLIQRLINERDISARIMLSIANRIPAQIWLKDFKLDEKDLTLAGNALVGEGTGFDQVTDFVTSLNENASLSDVKLLRSQKEKDEKGVEVTAFDVTAKRK